MNARLWLNTTNKQFSTGLGSGQFAFPTLTAFDEIYLRFKLAEEVGDVVIRDDRAVNTAALRVGWKNAAPTQGTFDLTITHSATSAVVSGLAYDVTASALQTAINAALTTASLTALEPCTVTDYQGTLRIVFEDNTLQPTITCTDNALWPLSFVDVSETAFDEGYAYRLKLRQAPVAETTVVTPVVPTAPSVSRLQAGSTTDGVAINEVQKLTVPTPFAGGSFRILRGGIKSDPVSVPIRDSDRIQEVLDELLDPGETFVVARVTDGYYIEFAGDLAGAGHDLLTIEVFEAPPTDYLVRLDTRTAAMETLMLGADEDGRIDVPLNLSLEVADGVTSGQYQKITFSQEVTFELPVSDDEHNASAAVDWNQPLSQGDYVRHSTTSLLVATRAKSFPIGNGSATEFTLNHDLVDNAQTFTANAGADTCSATGHGFSDNDPVQVSSTTTLPDPLASATIYFILNATANTFQLSATPGGTAINLTDAGTGTHTVSLRDGTTEYVDVTVWETGGDEERLSPDQYTVQKLSADSIKLLGFPATPTSGQYVAIVQAFGRPATYTGHTHADPALLDLPVAKTRIEALEARVLALESALNVNRTASAPSLGFGDVIRRTTLPSFVTVLPAPLEPLTGLPTTPDLSLLQSSVLPELPGGLLPAVHTSTVANVSTILAGTRLPRAASTYVGTVYLNNTGATLTTDGSDVAAGGYVACSGEARTGGQWFPVRRYEDEGDATTFTANASTDVVTFTDATLFKVGDAVRLTTSGTLPAGLSLATDYYILSGGGLATTPTGSAVNITDTGSGTHTATRQAEKTWYPVDFETVLYEEQLSDRKLPPRYTWSVWFGLEHQMFSANTRQKWRLVIEEGSVAQDTSPAPIGENISGMVWNTAYPVLDEEIVVDDHLSGEIFGFTVSRSVDSEGADVFAAKAIYYGQESATRAPTSANVAYRIRLSRPDTENGIADPEGTVVIAGLAPASVLDLAGRAGLGISQTSK